MMKPSPYHNSRFWAALSILLIGDFIALGLLGGDLRLWLSAWRQVTKTGLPGIAITFSLLVIAVVLSRSLATGISCSLKCIGPRFEKTGFWLGRALSLFPVYTLCWAFIGIWVGLWGFPIWSLMPVSADSTTLPFLERFSREAWTWSPAILLLSLPLMGQWLSLFPLPSPVEDPPKPTAEEVERSLATPHLDSPERLPGRPFETFLLRTRDGIQLPASMRKMVAKPHTDTFSNPVWWVGFLGFILLFSVEDIFGIHGSMSRLVQSLRSHDTQAAAPPVLMLSCVAAMGTCWAGSPVFTTPPTLRCALSWLCKGASWALIIVSLVVTTLAITIPGLPIVNSADIFTHPVTALWAGLPPMLCALSLWLLGHIFRSTNDPLPHA